MPKLYTVEDIWNKQTYGGLDKSVFNPSHKQIIKTVEQLINPEDKSLYDQTPLQITSAFRLTRDKKTGQMVPEGGAHGQGIALDVGGNPVEMFRLFEKLCVTIKENPTLGLGVMLGYKDPVVENSKPNYYQAQNHLHIISKPGYYLAGKFGFELVYIYSFNEAKDSNTSILYDGKPIKANQFPKGKVGTPGFPLFTDINDEEFKTFLRRAAQANGVSELNIANLKGEKIAFFNPATDFGSNLASNPPGTERQDGGFRRLVFKLGDYINLNKRFEMGDV